MARGDYKEINWGEVWGMTTTCAAIGIVRALYLVRQGRRFRWFDIALEPALAVIGGMCMWGLTEVTELADVIQAVLTSLGAWGGPKTIQWLELRYMGGRRRDDFSDIDPKATAPIGLGE